MLKIKKLPNRTEKEHSIVGEVFRQSAYAYLLTSLGSVISGLVDGVFIGHKLGVDAVAAYGMLWPLTLLLSITGSLLVGGTRALYTSLAGKGKLDEANGTFTISCLTGTVMTLGLIALVYAFKSPLASALGAKGEHANLKPLIEQYLSAYVLCLPFDSAGRIIAAFMGMDSDYPRVIAASIAMTVADVVGDALVILVFKAGMFGMGLTTAIGAFVFFIVISTHFTRKKRMLRFRFRGLSRQAGNIGRIIHHGAPSGIGRLASAAGGIMINQLIAASAASNYIAAFSVHKSAISLASASYMCVADTVWTLAGIYYGEEDRKALDKLQRVAVRYGILFTGIASLALVLLARVIAGIYLGSADAETLALGAQAVRYAAMCMPLYLIVFLFLFYLMGVGRLHASTIYNTLIDFVVRVPVVWVMIRLIGGSGSWHATPISLLILILVAAGFILARGSGKELRNKRLLLPKDFGGPPENELNISADTLPEVIGMSHLAGLFCREHGIDDRKANSLALCIEELGENIISHGFDDRKPHAIHIRILAKDKELILRVRDDCKPFNLVEQYEMTQNEKGDPAKNIGIRMVMKSCRDVQYLSTMSTNNLIIRI